MKLSLPQQFKIVEAMAPAADAAGRTSDYVSLKNVDKAWIVFTTTQGNAATIAITPKQATAVAGTSAKNLTVSVPIWANLDTATSDTLARATDATSYTTDAAIKNKVVVIEIDPRHLDVDGGFDCIAFTTGASNAANITQGIFILEYRYQQSSPPAAITD
jgi:hypothetical protein